MMRCRRTSYLIMVVTCAISIWLTSEVVLFKIFQNRTFRMKTPKYVLTNVETNALLNDTPFYYSKYESPYLNISSTKQRQTNSFISTRNLQNERHFIKTGDQRMYLFSAIGLIDMNITNQYTSYSSIVLTGWEHESIQEEEFTCCYMLNNDTILSEVSKAKRHWAYVADIQPKQYTCPVNVDTNIIKGIYVYINGKNCSHSKSDYLTPSFPRQRIYTSSIALCSKLSYRNLTASRLLEWFEAQKLFGVTKVLAYIDDNLNLDAKRVFEYYVSIGMAEAFVFDLPEKESIRRHIGEENMQFWNDEQIMVFDCQIRLQGYKYVGVIDTDEFMVPLTNTYNNSWITYLDATFHNKSNIAGIAFIGQVHATTWGPVNNSSKLFIGRYLNSTMPMYDRVKNIYMPSRVQIGSVSTHGFNSLDGFYRYNALNEEAVLHHYRTCRHEWLHNNSIIEDVKENSQLNSIYMFKSHQQCYDFRRQSSGTMQAIANILEPRVVKLCQQLNIKLTQ